MKFLIIALVIFLSSCTTASQVPAPTSLSKNGYILGAGDQLRVTVYGQEELSGEFTIDPGGQISLPLVKSTPASGMTVRQLEENITGELQPKYVRDPKVSVEVLQYRDIYILGEVRNPGKFAYVPDMTVLQAIALAGGHTYRADEGSAEITRLDKDILKTFKVETTYMIEPGDTITVKRRWF